MEGRESQGGVGVGDNWADLEKQLKFIQVGANLENLGSAIELEAKLQERVKGAIDYIKKKEQSLNFDKAFVTEKLLGLIRNFNQAREVYAKQHALDSGASSESAMARNEVAKSLGLLNDFLLKLKEGLSDTAAS
ncbi:MAG: hypothetical protein AAB408_00105 [Patescibacteria group bacterium]